VGQGTPDLTRNRPNPRRMLEMWRAIENGGQ
jgi:hypothetical protein